jgi:hypothetical protein
MRDSVSSVSQTTGLPGIRQGLGPAGCSIGFIQRETVLAHQNMQLNQSRSNAKFRHQLNSCSPQRAKRKARNHSPPRAHLDMIPRGFLKHFTEMGESQALARFLISQKSIPTHI